MPLPALDTVCFDSTLPLRFYSAADDATLQAAQRESNLALAVLAAPLNQDSELNPLLQRLEAKLDFVLELGLLARYPVLPPAQSCRIGLEAIIWHDSEAWPAGQSGLLQLHPQASSGCALYLPLTISHSQPHGTLQQHYARLTPFARDSDTQRWERWVFQQHRQHIGKTKS